MPYDEPGSSSKTFPVFPADFPTDTLHFHQALAEHNLARTEAGLPLTSFIELGPVEMHNVLARAQDIKDSARFNPIQLVRRGGEAPDADLPDQQRLIERLLMWRKPKRETFGLVGTYLLAIAIAALIVLLSKILG
jgi:hypothetical protein